MAPRIRAALNERAAALLAAVAASEQLLAALSAPLPRSTASSIACATSRWLAALKGIAVDTALDSVSLLLSEDGMDAGRAAAAADNNGLPPLNGIRTGGKSRGVSLLLAAKDGMDAERVGV